MRKVVWTAFGRGRVFLQATIVDQQVEPEAQDDLILALSDLATNAVRHDADVFARLDSFASVSSDDAPSRWIPRVFHGARGETDDQAPDPQVADQGKRSGPDGT